MEKSAFDPQRFKAQERAGFNLVANEYEQAMSLAQPATSRLLTLAELEPGMQVLDVATGPGLIARQVAELVGPRGRVVGVDIAEEAIAVARSKAFGISNLNFEVADAEALDLAEISFDRVLCGMGLMHFPNPPTALKEFKRVLKTGGLLVASVWGTAADAPFIEVALQTLSRNFPAPKVERPSMFRFGQPQVLQQLVEQAGFSQVQVHSVRLTATFADAASYWRTFLGAAGITAVALAKQPAEFRAHLEQDVTQDLAPYAHNGGYALTSIVQIVRGVA